MPAKKTEFIRGIAGRGYGIIRRMGPSDAIFLIVTVVGVALFTWRTIDGTPYNPVPVLALRGTFLAFTVWYVLIGVRRRQLLSYFSEAIEKTPTAFAIYDERDRLVARNRAYELAHGSAFDHLREPIYYKDVVEAACPPTLPPAVQRREKDLSLYHHRHATGKPFDRLYSDGRWLRVIKARTASGANVGVGIDVTELYEAKAAADREHSRFRGLAETLPIGIWHFDSEGRTIFVNRDLLDLFDLSGQTDIANVAAPYFIAAHVEGFDPAQLNDDNNKLGNLAIRTRDGRTRHVIIRTSALPAEAPGLGETIMSFIDVTPLKEAERRIDYLAHRDMLTGARNRAAFAQAIETAADISTDDDPCWILSMDLDDFKPINDQFGHAVGDTLLKEVVNRIETIGSPDSFLYRLGGDEFCIMLMGLSRPQVEDVAIAILEAIDRPFQLGHNRICVAASIGIAAIPLDATDADSAQRYADLALYSVKKRPGGGGGYAFFTKELAERDLQERIMTLDLSRALAGNDFEFAFQPIFRRADRAVVAIEALLRWTNRRTGEMVPPARFIAAAERSGIISRIDHWVFARVAAYVSGLVTRGIAPPLTMINMSPLTLEEAGFIAGIDQILRKFPDIGGHLCIEITEGVMVDDRVRLRETFRKLGDRGIRTAIDDFGTGQTSVALLRDIPVGFIKIDRSYVAGLETDPQAMAIVATIVRLSRDLGIRVIGEGVETQEQLSALETAGCDLIQGYLWSRPIPAADVEALLEKAEATDPPAATHPVSDRLP